MEGSSHFSKRQKMPTALYNACKELDSHAVASLLDQGADINEAGADGETALHLACVTQAPPILAQQLLRAKANPNVRATLGSHPTPLEIAIELQAIDTMKVLVEAKADVNEVNPHTEQSPITLAAEGGKRKIVQFLLENKANVHVSTGGTPLKAALHYPEIVELLLEHGADVNECDHFVKQSERNTTPPLFSAIKEQLFSTAKILLTNEQCQYIPIQLEMLEMLEASGNLRKRPTTYKVEPVKWSKSKRVVTLRVANATCCPQLFELPVDELHDFIHKQEIQAKE